KTIVKSLIKNEIEKGLAPKLTEIVENLPSRTGIYYVYNAAGDVIFIGKAKNIRKNVNQHFSGESRVSKKITAEVFRITFEETGSELIAALKEREEILRNRPVYNKPPRRKKSLQWGLLATADENGYLNLGLEKIGSQP